MEAAKASHALHRPVAVMPRLIAENLRDLLRFRSLVRYMVRASLKTQNTGTLFGHVWWLIDPFLLVGVYVLVVHVILHRGGEDYPVFVSAAVLPWKWFSSAIQQSIGVTVGKESLMKRVAFPRAVLPISSVLAGTVHFGFGLIVLLAFAIPFGISPHPIVLLVVAVVLIQFVLTLGIALFASALNIFFRDVGHAMTYLLRVGFYVSPGLYAVSQVPSDYRGIYHLNPFATIFPAYRSLLMEHTFPPVVPLALVGVASFVVLVAGYVFFLRAEPMFTKLT
jgi:lipopolysaccharide transport system permease protein